MCVRSGREREADERNFVLLKTVTQGPIRFNREITNTLYFGFFLSTITETEGYTVLNPFEFYELKVIIQRHKTLINVQNFSFFFP